MKLTKTILYRHFDFDVTSFYYEPDYFEFGEHDEYDGITRRHQEEIESHKILDDSTVPFVLLGNFSSGTVKIDALIVFSIRSAVPFTAVSHNPGMAFINAAKTQLKMLQDPQFSDFTITVEGKKFKVHRAILANASQVFAKLFTAEMKEARSGECTVEDIKPAIFEQLLEFIYGGKLPDNLANVSMKLYEAAHYYEIEDLKEICLPHLFAMIETANPVELFKWATAYDIENLMLELWTIIKR